MYRQPGAATLLRTLLLLQAAGLLYLCAAQAGVIDPSKCEISGYVDTLSDVVNTVIVTAFDSNGDRINTGGDLVFLKIEQECTVTAPSYGCALAATQDNVAGLPYFAQMLDNGDGTYTGDWSVTATGGTVTVTASYFTSFGFIGNYYANQDYTGAVTTITDDNLIWVGSGPSSFFSIIWTGYLLVTKTADYTFDLSADDYVGLTLDGNAIASGTISLDANAYVLECKYWDKGGGRWVKAKWSSPDFANVVIGGQSAVQDPEYIGHDGHNIEIFRSTIPTSSTIELSLTGPFPTDETHTIKVQGRDMAGVANLMATDVISVVFDLVRPASQGPPQQFTVPITHVSDGLYEITHFYTVTGDYIVSMTIENAYTASDPVSISTSISGSPLLFTVVPGAVDPSLCYYQVDTPATFPSQIAGMQSAFTVQFVDLHGNLHYDTMSDDGITLVVQAVYQNHDAYLSPIGVEDDPDWQATYGTTIPGTQVDNSDGTISADFTIYRAGEYTFSVTVDGQDIIDSPISPFQIAPASLSAPNCVPVEFPQSLTAGYEYSFLIQGRDIYDNNIIELVEDAVGTDFSAFYYLTTDNLVNVEALISDDAFPGVYLVEVALPKTLESGDFDFVGLLGGQQIPVPAVFVEPCTNFLAAELGIIAQAGNTFMLAEIVYTIKEEAIDTSLPLVPRHCEHKYTQILLSATATLASGTKLELDEEQLLSYGVRLEAMGETPLIEVYTEDLSLGGVTLDLIISATVIEEVSWSDTSLATIIFQSPEVFVFNSTDYASADPPTFNSDSADSKSLLMGEDDLGVKFLVPVILDCTAEWSRSLPAIIGEDVNSKIDLTVDLGDAKTILTYSPTQRVFEHAPNSDKGVAQVFTIEIKLQNQDGRSTSYSLRVIYKCTKLEEEKVMNSFEISFSKDPPIPRIESIDAYGEVTIRFDRLMKREYALSESEINSSSRETQRVLRDEDDDDEMLGMAKGVPTKTFNQFELIHNRTVVINGTNYPSLDMRISPDDPDSLCSSELDFEWEVTNFSGDQMKVRLNFTKPECISSSSVIGDLLVVTFYDQRLFGDTQGKFVWVGTETSKRLRHQIQLGGTAGQVLDAAADSATTAIMAASIFNIVTNLILQVSLKRLMNALKNLQIIVHIMLIQVFLVTHAEIFLQKLKEMIAFEAIDLKKLQQLAFSDVVENETVDIHFESMGYESSDAILNLGIIFVIIVLTPILLMILAISSYLCCCQWARTYSKNQISKTLFNRAILFFDGSFLVITVVCALNIYQVKKKVAIPNSSYYFSLAMATVILPILAILFSYLSCKVRLLRRKAYLGRVGAAYEDLDIKNKGRQPLVFLALSFSRRIALSAVVTFGRSSKVAQLFFMNSCSVLLIGYVGIMRPLETTWMNRLEMGNEYTILLLYAICVTQTDFVERIEGRMAMGWALIGLISLNIMINFGNILFKDLKAMYRGLKLRWTKRQRLLKRKAQAEKQARVNAYRAKVLEDQKRREPDLAAVLRNAPIVIQTHQQLLRQGLERKANHETAVDVADKLIDLSVEAVMRRTPPNTPPHREKRHYPVEEEKEGPLILSSKSSPSCSYVYNYTTEVPKFAQLGTKAGLRALAQNKNALPYVNTDYMTPEEAAKNFGLPVFKKLR